MTDLSQQTNAGDNKLNNLRVGIIGAGISGLSAAIALKNLGVNVSVLEQNKKDAHKWGYNLTLMDSTIGHLKDFNEDIVRKLDLSHTRAATRIPLYDENKELVYIPGPKKDDNVSLYRVSKDQLHQSLVECCENLGINIAWGADFHHYEEVLLPEGSGSDPILLTKENVAEKDNSDVMVRVISQKGANGTPSMVENTFDVLIGADGTQSGVRKQIRHDRKKYLNVLAVNGMLDVSRLESLKENPRLSDYYSFIQLGKGDSVWATLIDNELHWLLHVSARENEAKQPIQDKEQLKSNLLSRLTITSPFVRSIIEHTDPAHISTPTGVYEQEQMNLTLSTKRVVNTLSGRVTLIGDASNHCLPFLGQAKELMAKVAEIDNQSTAYKDLPPRKQKHKFIESFLSDAEIEINRRSKPFITGSEAGSAWFHKKGFLSRTFRNGALRLLGAIMMKRNI